MALIRNLWSLVSGLVAVLLGYLLLSLGHLSLGPILLVLGYCVAMPVFIWRRFRAGAGE